MKMQQGDLDFQLSYEKGTTYLGVDAHDLIVIESAGEDGMANVRVWDSTGPEAEIAWEGRVQIREREEEEDAE